MDIGQFIRFELGSASLLSQSLSLSHRSNFGKAGRALFQSLAIRTNLVSIGGVLLFIQNFALFQGPYPP